MTLQEQKLKDEWWLEGTRQCIEANINKNSAPVFHILEHIRVLVKQETSRLLQERADAIRGELDVWCDAQKERWQSDSIVNHDFAQGVQSGYGWMKQHLPHVFDKTLECRCPGRERAASIVEQGISSKKD